MFDEIVVETQMPKALWRDIKRGSRHGRIRTFREDADGDITHVSRQWKQKAWLRPVIRPGKSLTFKLIGQKGVQMDKAVAAFYVGHFIQMLCYHFNGQFSSVSARNSTPGAGRRLAIALADLRLRSALRSAHGL